MLHKDGVYASWRGSEKALELGLLARRGGLLLAFLISRMHSSHWVLGLVGRMGRGQVAATAMSL